MQPVLYVTRIAQSYIFHVYGGAAGVEGALGPLGLLGPFGVFETSGKLAAHGPLASPDITLYMAQTFQAMLHISGSLLLQVGPEQAICNMLEAIKGWTSILVIAAAIAIGFALILRGLAPEFSNQFQGAIRSVIVGLIVIAVLPMVASFILTSLGASGTGTGCTS